MTDTELRDTFAAAALTGLLSSLPNGDQYHPFAVENAWSLADAMLRERCNVKTPNDAMPMAGSGSTVPANDRASDCSEDGRVRASASSIGNTQEPVAWAVMVGGRRMYVSWCKEMCEDEAYYHRHPLGDSVSVVPLYRHRQPTLTHTERVAVEIAADACGNCNGFGGDTRRPALYEGDRIAATLRGLLGRLGDVAKKEK